MKNDIDNQPDDSWAFVIDTDSYAGNFERQICAFITGTLGECGVGDDMLKHFNQWLNQSKYKDNPFEEIIMQVIDEHGCRRPVCIAPNPNWSNHGMGESFRLDDPDFEKKSLASYVKQIETYEDEQTGWLKNIKPVPKEKAKNGEWTEEAIEKEKKRRLDNIIKSKNLKKVHRYPAYNSVAIFFECKPPHELIQLMKQRAQEYVESSVSKQYPTTEKITIEGFRLVHKVAQFAEETV